MKNLFIVLVVIMSFNNLLAQTDTVIFNETKGEYEITYRINLDNKDSLMNIIFIPSNQINPQIRSRVIKNDSTYIYKYLLTNSLDSKTSLEQFLLEIINPVKYKNVSNNNWDFGIESRIRGCSWLPLKGNLRPGEYQGGFCISSDNLPGIGNAYLQGPTPLYTLSEEETSEYLYRVLDSLQSLSKNYILKKTITPTNSLQLMEKISIVDSIISFVERSFSFNWVLNENIKKKYQAYLSESKTALQQNNNPLARYYLKNILRDVEIDSTSEITSEAYALIRYNTEYLLSKIPEENPRLDGITPEITTTKTKEFTLTTNGNGFTPLSQIMIDGTPYKTEFVSGTKITAEITNKDLKKEGNYKVSVKNEDGRRSEDRSLSIYKKLPEDVVPLLNCIELLGKDKYRAWFGYENKNKGTVLLDHESENKFDPAPQDRGRPIIFKPGKYEKVFSVEFEGNKKLMWKVDKEKVTADKNSKVCE